MNPDKAQKYYLKQCKTNLAFERELYVYNLGLDCVPRLIEAVEPLGLKLELVSGVPYFDYPGGFDPQLLAKTIAGFHLCTLKDGRALCHHDNQPGNILYDGDRYYLIDFSDSIHEVIEHDITHLLLFWAEEYRISVFCDLVQRFIVEYSGMITIDYDRFGECLHKNIKRFDDRRQEFVKLKRKNALEADQNRRWLLQYKTP